MTTPPVGPEQLFARAAAPAGAAVIEVRVHGVGGSHGHRMLGLTDPNDAVVVVSRRQTSVLARAGQQVRSYDWGNLTSGSRFHVLWIVLLPFTLVNVAGWTHPPVDRQAYGWLKGQAAHTRFLVGVAGLLLTSTWVLWLCDLAVVLGHQGTGRLEAGWMWVPPGWLPGWSYSWLFGNTFAKDDAQRFGVIAAALAVVVAFVGLYQLNRLSQVTADEDEKTTPSSRTWSADGEATFTAPDFFRRKRSFAGRIELHAAAAAMTLLAAAVVSVDQLVDNPQRQRIGLEPLFGAVGSLTVVVVGLLWLVSWAAPWLRSAFGSYDRPATGRAAGAVTLAFAVTNAVFSGGLLWIIRRMATPEERATQLPIGKELAFTDAYAWLVLLWALVAATVVGVQLLRVKASPCADETIDSAWRKPVARAQAIARLCRKGDTFAVALAAVAWVVAAVVGARRVSWTGPALEPLEWFSINAPSGRDLMSRAGAWLLPAIVVLVARELRQASSAVRLRTTFGTIFDVTTFWPRRFHALAIRPYARRAVPELRSHVQGLVESGHPVVVVAHSLGSVLAVAALAPLDPRITKRVALVTFGSPLATVFGRAFPAYVNDDSMAALAQKLAGWHNFHRLTDPIGGPLTASQIVDECLPDPAIAPSSTRPPQPATPLERDRQPNVDLAVHSYYLNEWALKAVVDRYKVMLRSAEAAPPPPTG